jgi:multimeric flavodoxin WrbA
MKVVAVNGSARKNGNTTLLIKAVFEPLEEAGVTCELIELAGRNIRGCTACGKCTVKRDGVCYGRRDDGNAVIERLGAADGIILGSPVYFSDVSSELKAIMDRAGYVGRAKRELFRRKPGAAVVAVRRAGAIHTFDTINHFFSIAEMVTVGSSYWNIGIGRERGEVEGDAEGMRTMRHLGENMAWLLERIGGEAGPEVERGY